MAPSKRNNDDWVKQIQATAQKEGRYPPGYDKGGWKTFTEIMQEQGIGHNKLRRLIQKGCDSGEIDAFEGTAPNVTGRLCRSVWYKIVQNKDN